MDLKLRGRGVRAFGAALDVTNADDYVAWLASAVTQLGGIDIFVHNVTASPSTPGLDLQIDGGFMQHVAF